MALIARGQGHRPVSALEAGLIAASLCEFVFLGAALCAVFSPELVPWLVPWLSVLLACASASAIILSSCFISSSSAPCASWMRSSVPGATGERTDR